MKKLILLSISVFLGLQLAVSTSAKAQNFQIVASFGSTHNWGVPTAIMYEVDYFYPYHRFIHVNRFYRGRNLFFNVLLEDHGHFVELTFGRGGNIINTNHFNNYPLASHICSNFCGYHRDYYFQQQVVCRSNYHRGHNHVNYFQQPRYSRNSRPSSVRVVNTRHRGQGYGNGHGHHRNEVSYRGQNKSYKRYDQTRNDNSQRVSYTRGSSRNSNNNNRTIDQRNNRVEEEESNRGNGHSNRPTSSRSSSSRQSRPQ